MKVEPVKQRAQTVRPQDGYKSSIRPGHTEDVYQGMQVWHQMRARWANNGAETSSKCLQVLSQACIGTFQCMTTSTNERGSSICQGLVTVMDHCPVDDWSTPADRAVASERNDTK